MSADLAYHPPDKTPKPRTQGVESATVVGPPGEEIHTDEFGRVRVQFHWDREGGFDENSSCWIRVSQPWGGSGYGATSLPRVGQEVLVDFLAGDPDRPVITGRVYTNLQKTPYKLPDNKTQSGWKSNSTGGGGGYNELMFEDARGKELLRMQAERDMDTLVQERLRRAPCSPTGTSYVGAEATPERVNAKEAITVTGERSVTVMQRSRRSPVAKDITSTSQEGNTSFETKQTWQSHADTARVLVRHQAHGQRRQPIDHLHHPGLHRHRRAQGPHQPGARGGGGRSERAAAAALRRREGGRRRRPRRSAAARAQAAKNAGGRGGDVAPTSSGPEGGRERMKIARVTTSGVRGLPDRTFELADPATGRPLDVVFVTGPPGAGKTSFLDAIAAAKEDVAPYGPRRSPAPYVRRGAVAAKIRIDWWLTDDERAAGSRYRDKLAVSSRASRSSRRPSRPAPRTTRAWSRSSARTTTARARPRSSTSTSTGRSRAGRSDPRRCPPRTSAGSGSARISSSTPCCRASSWSCTWTGARAGQARNAAYAALTRSRKPGGLRRRTHAGREVFFVGADGSGGRDRGSVGERAAGGHLRGHRAASSGSRGPSLLVDAPEKPTWRAAPSLPFTVAGLAEPRGRQPAHRRHRVRGARAQASCGRRPSSGSALSRVRGAAPS